MCAHEWESYEHVTHQLTFPLDVGSGEGEKLPLTQGSDSFYILLSFYEKFILIHMNLGEKADRRNGDKWKANLDQHFPDCETKILYKIRKI